MSIESSPGTATRRRGPILRPLTDAERKLAEDNAQLIYGYLWKKELDVDEWYDIATEGFLKAVITWNPARSRFSTHAYQCMRTAVSHELKTRSYQMRNPRQPVLYLDAGEDLDYHQIITVGRSFEAEAELAAFIDTQVLPQLTDQQRNILQMRIEGWEYKHIAKRYGLSIERIRQKLAPAKELLRAYFATN